MKFNQNDKGRNKKYKMILLMLSVILIAKNSSAQFVSVKGSYISITAGTVLGLDTLSPDNSSTVENAGIINTYTINNAGSILGNGTYNILQNFINTGSFSAGSSSVNYNGSVLQNVAALTYFNLSTGGNSIKTANGAVSVNGTLNLNSSSTLDMVTYVLSGSLTSLTGTGILKTQNTSSTPIPSGKTWPFDIQYNSSSTQTIVLGNYINLNGAGGDRTLSSGTTGIAGTFTVGSGTYTVTGSTIDFNGGGAQNIPAFTFENITVSGGNTKTIAGNINLSGVLTLSANTTMALSSNNITLTSTSTGTGRVAAVPSTALVTYGTGKFIVQRYIQGRRKYRLMTSSVTTYSASTLSAGQEALSIWGNWQNQGNTGAANSGTIITGGTSGDGYDQNTTNASLYTYDEANRRYVGFSSANGKNTKYTPLKAGTCYYMFVYGDRTNTVSTSTPNYTVLSSAGTILTGDQTYNTASTIPLTNTVGNYTMLGNPFASPINWATVTKTNLYNTFWGWDPNLSSTGGYVTVSTTGTVTLISPFSGSVGLNQYIQSGQGFFVRTSAVSPSLAIKESDKVANYNNNAFRTTNAIPLIAINLFDNNTNTLMDGALAAFDDNFSNHVGKEDASKILGSAETISISTDNELLSIDARQLPQDNDTIFLKAAKLTKSGYTLQIFCGQMENKNVHPFLTDSYLNTVQALSVTDTNRISFSVASNPASYNPDRFKIIFSAKNYLPVITPTIKSELKVFPNPVKNQQINFQINDLTMGVYTVALLNPIGQQIVSRNYDHIGGAFNQIIYLDKKLPKGIYHLNISSKSVQFNKAIFVE